MSTKHKLRFLITSDTHDVEPGAATLQNLPSVDFTLHCGDLTNNGDPSQLEAALELLSNLPGKHKLVIAGNHDACLDRKWYIDQDGDEQDCDKAIEIVNRYRAKGVILLDEGVHKFTLRDGISFKVYASPYTPTHGTGAFQYPTAVDRFGRLDDTDRPEYASLAASAIYGKSTIPKDVDIVMTHGPPKYILDRPAGLVGTHFANAGCEHLNRAIKYARPLLHAFGHVHCGYGAHRCEWTTESRSNGVDWIHCAPEIPRLNAHRRDGFASLARNTAQEFLEANRGDWRRQTLFVNASMVNSDGEHTNLPWLVELEI